MRALGWLLLYLVLSPFGRLYRRRKCKEAGPEARSLPT